MGPRPARWLGCPASEVAIPLDAAIDALDALVRQARSVLLSGPQDTDGDSVGACLALASGLVHRGVDVHVAGDPTHRYDWLPGASTMRADEALSPEYDLVVVLDGDRTRLTPAVTARFQGARFRAIVDHHASTTTEGYDLALLDPRRASTTAMVMEILDRWGIPLGQDIAAQVYTGLVFDTGGFRHSNTTPETHALAARLLATGIDHSALSARVLMDKRPSGFALLGQVIGGTRFLADGRVALGLVSQAQMQALGADRADLEGIVDALLYVVGVELACLAIERGPDQVKLSLRSRTDIDVSALAKRIGPGGGGHAKAAGVILQESLASAEARLPRELEAALPRAPAGR